MSALNSRNLNYNQINHHKNPHVRSGHRNGHDAFKVSTVIYETRLTGWKNQAQPDHCNDYIYCCCSHSVPMMNGGLIRRLARGTDLQSAIFLQQVWLRLSNKLGRNCVSLSLSLVFVCKQEFFLNWVDCEFKRNGFMGNSGSNRHTFLLRLQG